MHTKSLKNYFFRLLVFALVSQVPFMLFLSLFTDPFKLNVFFTLFFGLLSIAIYEKLNQYEGKYRYSHALCQVMGFVAVLALAFLASFARCDYGYFGVLVIFVFYFFRDSRVLRDLCFAVLVFIFYGEKILFGKNMIRYLYIAVFTVASLIFINLYNHKKGKDIKYILYLFYPLHLLILYAIQRFVI